MPASSDRETRSDEVAREQSLIQLEQAIADCAQLVGDRDQARIDHAQLERDVAHRNDLGQATHRPDGLLAVRQARSDREQLSRDVGQEALDEAQRGRDEQQEDLDQAWLVLELPVNAPPHATSEDIVRQGALDRAVAARGRAEAHLIRAHASMTRAQAAEARARALTEPES